MFKGMKLRETLQDIIMGCEICQCNNPHNQPLPPVGIQRQGSYPGEDWQIDFIHMPGSPCSHLFILVNTFTGRVEASAFFTEKAREMVKVLIQEAISRFVLLHSLQSNNGPAFQAEVTQGVSKTLGIKYHLH
jgi:hypothetical protein